MTRFVSHPAPPPEGVRSRAARDVDEPSPPGRTRSGEPQPPIHVETERPILVVDDDDDIRDALSDVLCFEGFAVEVSRNGLEAIELLRAPCPLPSLILLDLMMPVLDGRAFLWLKARDANLKNIPVVVLTAGGNCRELEASESICRCLPKTVALKELVATIRACRASETTTPPRRMT
jgi:DNA-binding response OmpR family regulator